MSARRRQSADYAAVGIAAIFLTLRRLRDRVKDHRRRYPRDLAGDMTSHRLSKEEVAPEPEI